MAYISPDLAQTMDILCGGGDEMKMSKGEYRQFAGKNAPRSAVGKNMLKAFVSGVCFRKGKSQANPFGFIGCFSDEIWFCKVWGGNAKDEPIKFLRFLQHV